MLGKEEAFNSIPYFWTVQFGKSLRYCGKITLTHVQLYTLSVCQCVVRILVHYAMVVSSLSPGHALSWDEIIYDGSPEEQKFAAYYIKYVQ